MVEKAKAFEVVESIWSYGLSVARRDSTVFLRGIATGGWSLVTAMVRLVGEPPRGKWFVAMSDDRLGRPYKP